MHDYSSQATSWAGGALIPPLSGSKWSMTCQEVAACTCHDCCSHTPWVTHATVSLTRWMGRKSSVSVISSVFSRDVRRS